MVKTLSKPSKAKTTTIAKLRDASNKNNLSRAGGVLGSGRVKAQNKKPKYKQKIAINRSSGKNSAKTGSIGRFKNQNKNRNRKANQGI